MACVKLWDAKHPNGVRDNVGNFPNAYFDSSLEYHEAVGKAKKKIQMED